MIEVALFGAGRIGKIHAANLAAQPGVQFKYVVDVNQEAAAALAGLHGASVASVEAVLADPEVKAVLIASSTDTHADLIVRAAAAGKAIFCEKPVDLTLERARAAAAAVNDAGVLCMIGFQRR
ncbi:MAG: Gfo/Idh/MocA family oxidoreductase, partial [Janthinobacterium sp.]